MKINKISHLFLIIGFSLMIAACATPATMTQDERTDAYIEFIKSNKLESIQRITSFDFYSWTALGDEHLIINTRFNRPYLITLQRSCFDLSFANTIVIHRNGSSLHTKFDAISVMEPISVKCFIKLIHPLSKEQAKAIKKIGYAEDKPSEEHLTQKDKDTDK